MISASIINPTCERRGGPVSAFRSDVVRGLRATPKELPCKYFYDEAGSKLFDRICDVEEYYLTRTELGIMREHAPAMARLIGAECLLIEYGSGSGVKTRLLLDNLVEPAAYVPVDISGKHLRESSRRLAARYPHIDVLPLWADFTRPFALPAPNRPASRRVVYFPGSTIGNLTPGEAGALLRQTARLCGRDGAMLLGVDLKKDPAVLTAAYNDQDGISAAFNLNLLARINRELGANFQLTNFWHHAFYQPIDGRIEMHLISRDAQMVRLGEEEFHFDDGETTRTEYSYKYSLEDLDCLASCAGLKIRESWIDARGYFAVCYLTPQR